LSRTVLRREEIPQSSETAFSRSRQLLEKTRDLRDIGKPRRHHHRGTSREV
jgi:hypothetical protein